MTYKISGKQAAASLPEVQWEAVSLTETQMGALPPPATTSAPQLKDAREVLAHRRKFSLDKLLINAVGLISPGYLFIHFPPADNDELIGGRAIAESENLI